MKVIGNESHVFIAVEQRLDGLRSKASWAYPDPYLEVTVGQGDDRAQFRVTPELARQLATGLRRAAKRAEA